jgi:hypothetical protein
MKIINIIKIVNGVVTIEGTYPIIINTADDFGRIPTPEEQEQRIMDAIHTHFKDLIQERIGVQSQWDKDILKNILDEEGSISEEEFLNRCVASGYFGYPHDNDVEYQILEGVVFDLNIYS